MSTDNKYQFKGTPGPWGIQKVFNDPILVKDPLDGQEWYSLEYWIKGGNTMIGGVKYSTYKGRYRNVNTIVEFDANAHLIATAPDLLEACIEVLSFLPEESSLPLKTETQVGNATKKLRAAIHKALNI